jgi:hypothetical protein
MKLLIGIALAGLFTLTALTADAAKLVTTIEIADQTEDTVTFAVTRSVPFDRDTIWVTNQCWDGDGNLVIDRDAAVRWGWTTNLNGHTGEMPTDGETCTAYTTLKPWQKKPPPHAPIVSYTP